MKRVKTCALQTIQTFFGMVFAGCDQRGGTESMDGIEINSAIGADDILTPESHQISTNELYQMALNAFYQHVLYL